MHTITLSDQELRTLHTALNSLQADEEIVFHDNYGMKEEEACVFWAAINVQTCKDILKKIPPKPPKD